MRLIDAHTLEIHEFLSEDAIPDYAILSHTWGQDECTLQEMQNLNPNTLHDRDGFIKIRLCCEQALKDGLPWAWVDTCCIDKTSTAELSEAINSMFRWYRQAKLCYAYIADAETVDHLAGSRWFTRGWTLQELVAPSDVLFYNSNWQYLGSKSKLRQSIQRVTGIEAEALIDGRLDTVSIAKRMSWAANRQTTRIEDKAYSLMGIFDVNMPLLYGEGKKAFLRLQEAILRISDDHSLFAWGLPFPRARTVREFLNNFSMGKTINMHGIFADSPSDFTHSDDIIVLQDPQSAMPPIVSNNGVRIELQVKRVHGGAVHFAIIYCTVNWDGRWFARCGELVAIPVAELIAPESDVPYRKPEALFLKAPTSLPQPSQSFRNVRLVQTAHAHKDHYRLDVRCSPHATYRESEQSIFFSKDEDVIHAILHYAPAQSDPLSLLPEPDYRRLKHGTTTIHNLARQQDSFLSTAKVRRSDHGLANHDTYLILYPAFAIIVGGTQAEPWVETVLILDDNDPDADFQRLLAVDKRLIRSCATMRFLLSLLEHDTTAGSLSRRPRQHDRRLVMHWHYSYIFRETIEVPGWEYERDSDNLKMKSFPKHVKSKGEQWLSVDAQVQMVWSNLVERGLVLFVELKEASENKSDIIKPPPWWTFRAHDQSA
ncbi:HET-domain-containing protein [Setomelanomma holmii]|uniref:HET-domain-containing protein n=1 Tax=Setomelanomma holmii TaxID=210430 RepID=A0A9P4H600_9PLEO|nr:HET-domain-containing protein [Setomelanomma holmii]